MVGGGRKKIDWGMAAFAFNLISALILGSLAWGLFNGSTNTRLDAIQHQLDRLEVRVNGLRQGG